MYVKSSVDFSNLDFLPTVYSVAIYVYGVRLYMLITKRNLHLLTQLFLFFCSCPGSDMCRDMRWVGQVSGKAAIVGKLYRVSGCDILALPFLIFYITKIAKIKITGDGESLHWVCHFLVLPSHKTTNKMVFLK